mmetsp:Transcript_10675/g.39880  ORF Transcript_10675/g.39880 Transcript_10675/m.39880 type:complete len:186 (+) Transcript_10675:1263-1820(+)
MLGYYNAEQFSEHEILGGVMVERRGDIFACAEHKFTAPRHSQKHNMLLHFCLLTAILAVSSAQITPSSLEMDLYPSSLSPDTPVVMDPFTQQFIVDSLGQTQLDVVVGGYKLVIPTPIPKDNLKTQMSDVYYCAEKCSEDVSKHDAACKKACSLNAYCLSSCEYIMRFESNQVNMCSEICSYAAD